MENKVLSKVQFCKNIEPYNVKLYRYSVDQIKMEYEIFKLKNLFNGIISICIPTEEEEPQLITNKINITLYVYNNLMFSMNLLDTAISNDKVVNSLKDAMYDIYKESFNTFYDIKNDKIDWNKHDKYLKTFRTSLKNHLIILRDLGSFEAQSFILCYARTVFEKRQFQAPYRFSIEEATRDAMGLTNLWIEYLQKWKLKELFLVNVDEILNK